MHIPLYILIGRYINKTLATVEIPTTAGVFVSVPKTMILGTILLVLIPLTLAVLLHLLLSLNGGRFYSPLANRVALSS